MTVSTIIMMTSIGVATAIGDKILTSMGKTSQAQFCDIAGISGIGIIALKAVIDIIQEMSRLQ